MRKLIIITIIAIVVGGAAFYLSRRPAIAPSELSPSVSPSPTPEQNIVVTSPQPGDRVGNPITVTGKARTFEQTFNYALKDAQGNKLFESYGMTHAPDVGIFGDFTVKIPVPLGASGDLIVEVFEYSAKDGSVINLVRVPVKLNAQGTTSIKVYFSNSTLPGSNTDCSVVGAVPRVVLKTSEPAYIALTELLKGPTESEKQAGYGTSIPADVRINSIVIRKGTAYADFNETLQYQVGGSCRVTAIRSQITETLRQFSSVKNVVISINGRTEDILQP